MNTNEYITVSDLNTYIKTYLDDNYFLADLYVKGEVTNFKRHSTGTLYFQIKDDKCRVSCIMFNYLASKLKFPIKEGDMILIRGKISLYETTGSYSLVCNEIIYDSVGNLFIEYEKLKAKLASEGLFDVNRKKPIPKYPNTIGIVTASTGAAIHDIVKTLYNRWPLAKIILFPCLVQGENAPNDIIRALNIADNYGVDVIICGRGGGSIEDLWCFNDESLAYKVSSLKTPIISGVGHQVDFTIMDFVADLRALTPTDAALQATPNITDELNNIIEIKDRLVLAINNYLNNARKHLEMISSSYLLNNPTKIYENYRFQLDNLITRLSFISKSIIVENKQLVSDYKNNLNIYMKDYLVNLKKHLDEYKLKLDGYSPESIMKLGYSIALNKNRNQIKSIDDVNNDEIIEINVIDGTINAKVVERIKGNGRKTN